jgi:hypothetical protein
MELAEAPGPEIFATRAANRAWPDRGTLENFYIINSGNHPRPTTNRVPFSDPEDLDKVNTIRSKLINSSLSLNNLNLFDYFNSKRHCD